MRESGNLADAIAASIGQRVEAEAKRRKTTTGTVTRVDADGTIWCDMGDGATPCEGTTATVMAGDTVSVTVEDGHATVTGNLSRPSTDDTAANAAHKAARTAQSTAEAADQNALAAADAASSAQASADSAATAAQNAWDHADEAATAASDAKSSADSAATAASDAQTSADSAAEAAMDAWNRAGDALTAAHSAQDSAAHANTYANAALGQLGVVQDVIGVLDWVTSHGRFVPTEDVEVDASKTYYAYDSVSGGYAPVVGPTASDLPGYFELEVDEAIQGFIMSHLAVTERGLWVIPNGIDAQVERYIVDSDGNYLADDSGSGLYAMAHEVQYSSGYKVLLANDGMHVYDGEGVLVSTFGESIDFSSTRAQHIGNEDAYIAFIPATASSGARLVIGGANVTVGESMTLSQLISTLDSALQPSDVSVSQNPTATGYDVTIGDSTFSLVNGAPGADGASVSIASQAVTYQVGSSATDAPTGTWGQSPQATRDGEYLWTRTVVTYTDGTDVWSTTSYSVAAHGETGQQGPQGETGTGITSTTVTYGTSASAATQPSSWSGTAPTSLDEGTWLWTKTVTAYSDGTDTTAYSKSYVGTTGAAGTTYYTHIRYSASADGTDHVATPTASTVYIGTYTGTSSTAPSAKTSYKWSRYVGQDGMGATVSKSGDTVTITDGAGNAVTVSDGSDGHTPTITTSHSGTTTTIYADGTSIGTVEDGADGTTPTITASKSGGTTTVKVDGTTVATIVDGTSVTVSNVEYGTSASAATQPSSWSTAAPTSISKGLWLWVKTTYSDGSTATTKSYVGTDGEDGKSVFVRSATKSGDTTTVVIADTDGNTSTLTIKDGEDGANGTNGKTGYVHTAWANSADGATDFSTTVSAGKQYLGVYTDNTAADSDDPSAYNWSLIKGEKGDTGPAGTSVTVSSIEYAVSADESQPTSGWSSTAPSTVAEGYWLWVKTTYSDSTEAVTRAKQGTSGASGTSYYTHIRYSGSPDGTGHVAAPTSSTKYIGIYTGTSATAPTSKASYTWSRYVGEDGGEGHSPVITTSYDSATHVTTVCSDGTVIATIADGEDGTTPTITATKSGGTTTVMVDGTAIATIADGISVTVSSVEYGTSASAGTAPSSWSATVPTSIAQGKWLWVKTTYSDGSTATTKSYVGTDGEDGKSVYVQSTSKADGVTTVTLSDGTTTTTIQIADGEDGDDGQSGVAGDDSYVHFAWANSADGSTDFSTSVSAGKLYMGVYSDNDSADSQTPGDYSWTLIKGEKGETGPQGIQGEKGDTGATGPQGPQGEAGHSPAVTTVKNADGSVTIYVDGTATSTVDAGQDGSTPVITTAKNADGSVTIYVDGTASNTVEAGADGTSYYTYVRYSANASGSGMVVNPTSATKYIGVYTGTSSSVPSYTGFKWSKYVGEDGSNADPLTVTAQSIDYQLSASGTTAPTGEWSETPLAPTTTQFLWTRTTLTFSDGSSLESYSVGGKTGAKGEKGDTGPEAQVTVRASAIDFVAGSATLAASLSVDGQSAMPTGYEWFRDGASVATGQTVAVSSLAHLNAVYTCTVTWPGGVQSGSIDLRPSYRAHMESVCRTQRVYYRSAEPVNLAPPATWTAQQGNVYGAWTCKVPPLAESTAAGFAQYPYLYTCLQSQTYEQVAAGSACTASEVLLDEGVTVIPGSLLVKGSVSTEELAADSVTADKIAANAITIGTLAQDVTDKLDGMEDAVADSSEVRYDNEWTLANGVYSFEAHALRGAVDVTDELPDEFFTWYLRNEAGDAYGGCGKTYSVAAASAGWRPYVVGCLEDSVEYALTDGSGSIVDSAGDVLIACWVA